MRQTLTHVILSAVCAALLTEAAGAAPLVSGTVTARNGTPLADVQVQVEISTAHTATPSDAQGRFQFDAATLFSPKELRSAGGLILKFSKSGFQPVNHMVPLAQGQVTSSIKVLLDPTGGSAALGPAEKKTLDQYAGAPGSTPLFLIPYSFSGLQTAEPKNLNEILRANLERVINTHVQSSRVAGSRTISMKLLPIEQGSDIDRMRTYGIYLNALGMITGYGVVETATGGSRSLGVTSTFLVVPEAEEVGAPILYVDDDVPADAVASPRLYKSLSKLWGRSAMLALGVKEFRQAVAGHDKTALSRIRGYLQEERAGIGPGDEALLSQLNILITAVDKELAR